MATCPGAPRPNGTTTSSSCSARFRRTTRTSTRSVRAAFDYACDHHAGQLRKSGEPFIHHPAAVAAICAELKLDSATITAALLHDTVEDTEASIEEVRERFGERCRRSWSTASPS